MRLNEAMGNYPSLILSVIQVKIKR
jgi:hypothetical protein